MSQFCDSGVCRSPSRNAFLAALATLPDIDWDSVVALHMDEYIGLPEDAPQGFGNGPPAGPPLHSLPGSPLRCIGVVLWGVKLRQ